MPAETNPSNATVARVQMNPQDFNDSGRVRRNRGRHLRGHRFDPHSLEIADCPHATILYPTGGPLVCEAACRSATFSSGPNVAELNQIPVFKASCHYLGSTAVSWLTWIERRCDSPRVMIALPSDK